MRRRRPGHGDGHRAPELVLAGLLQSIPDGRRDLVAAAVVYRLASEDGDGVSKGMVGQVGQNVPRLAQRDEVGREPSYDVPTPGRGPGPCREPAETAYQPIEIVGAIHAGEANFRARAHWVLSAAPR